MTIKDLEYIHNLLREDVGRRENAKEILRKDTNHAEETCADNYSILVMEYKKARDSYNMANSVLQNFEYEEWK